MLIFIRSLAIWVALLSLVPSFTFAQEPAATPPQILSVPGSESVGPLQCFDWYRFGSVQADVQPVLSSTVSGSMLSFTGVVINDNEYPLVDGTLYAKVFREDGATFGAGDGNVVVDQFVVASDIALPAKGTKDISFDWRVPVNAMTGDYYVAYYFATSDRYNLLGLSFTDDVVGNTARFSVTGEEGALAPVALSKVDTTINGQDHRFAAFPLHFDFTEPVKITTTVTNDTNQSKTLPIQWTQYAWDGLREDNVRNVKTSLLTLAPNETKEVSYDVKPQGESVVFVTAVVQDIQAKSYLNVRYVQDGIEETRINFPSITKFPLEAGIEQTLFACAHSTNFPLVEGNTLKLELTDASGNRIHSYTYEGAITGEMAGFGETFTPSASYDNVTLTATLERRGEVVESVSVTYDCAQIGGDTCFTSLAEDVASGDLNPSQLVMMAVGIIVLVLIVIIVSVMARKKGPGPSTLALFLVFAFVSSLFAMAPMSVEAKTVTWNYTDTTGTYSYNWTWSGYGFYNIWPTVGGGGWTDALRNPNYTITYGADVYNDSAGGVLVSDNASIPVGTQLRFVPKPHVSSDISWFGTGYSGDSPNGDWVANAGPSHIAPVDMNTRRNTGACRAQDYVGSAPAVTGGNWDIFIPMSVNPPTIAVAHSGTAGLSCDASQTNCTVTGPGTINSTFTYAPTYAKLYYRYASTLAYDMINPYADVNNCDSVAFVRDTGGGPEPCEFRVAANACFGDNTPLSKDRVNDFVLTVPQQTVAFTFTVPAAANANPNPPTITGPASGDTNVSLAFTFTATDSDNDNIYYEIDWDNNGTVDARTPGSSFVTSGTGQSSTRSWGTVGARTFQARTVDSNNNRSTWTSRSVTITSTPTCTTVGYAATSIAQFNTFSNQCISDGYSALEIDQNVEYGDLGLISSNQKCLVTQDVGTGWRARLYANPSCGLPPSVFADISGTGCTIAQGASTCTGALSWTISNATSPNVRNLTNNTQVSTLATGSNSPTLTHGSNIFEARNGATPLNDYVLTTSCAAGSVWNGTTCAASGPSCPITSWDCYDETIIEGPNTGTSYTSCQPATSPRPANGGCVVIGSYASSNTYAGTFASIPGGAYECSNACGGAPAVTGYINGSGCTIPAGGNSCSGSLTWSASNASSVVVRNDGTGATVSTNANQPTSFAVPVSYGNTTFSLRNSGVELDTQTLTASCANGTLWDGSTCQVTAGDPNTCFTQGVVNAAGDACGPSGDFVNALGINFCTDGCGGGCGAYDNQDHLVCILPMTPSASCSPNGSAYEWNGSAWVPNGPTGTWNWDIASVGGNPALPPPPLAADQLTPYGMDVDQLILAGGAVGSAYMCGGAMLPTTVDLRINNSNGPVTVNVGDILNLNWMASGGVTSCTAFGNGWSNGGPVPLAGATSFPAVASDTYILNCDGIIDSVDVIVNVPVTPPTANLQVSVGGAPWSTASPQSMTQGQTLAVQWSSTDADSCTGTNVTTGTLRNGTDTAVPRPAPGSSLTYSVTCSNSSGSATANIQVQTLELPNLTVSLVANLSAGFDATTGEYDFVQASFIPRNSSPTNLTVSTAYLLQLDLDDDGSIDRTVPGTLNPINGNTNHPNVNESFLNIPFGSHRVIVQVDSGTAVDESNEADNTNSVSLTVPPPDPGITLNIQPSTLVRSGDSVDLAWSIANAYPTLQCTLSGPSLTTVNIVPSITASGNETTGAITAKSDYTLSCTETITGTVFSATQSVETTGTVEEI